MGTVPGDGQWITANPTRQCRRTMLRRTLLKLFVVSPLTGVLFALRNPYWFHTTTQDTTTIWLANPQYHRKRLPHLWSEHRSLVEAMADKCLATAKSRDTRSWTTKQWNRELDETKWQWQLDRVQTPVL